MFSCQMVRQPAKDAVGVDLGMKKWMENQPSYTVV